MSKKTLYLCKKFKKTAKEVVISNSKLNSFWFRVLTSGIDLTQYLRNPILLWSHNRPWRGTTDEVLPIGRMENLRIDGDNLIGTPVFDENDEFAKKIKAKFESGFLKMVSPGLETIELSDDPAWLVQGQRRSTVTKSKLIEVSIVDIGANDDAIALYKDGKIVCLSSAADISFIPELTPKGTDNNIINENELEMKSIALKLGLQETATENDILSKIGEMQTRVSAVETLQKELKDLHEASITAEVDAAVKLGKFTADKREHFINLGKSSGIEVLKSTLELMSPAVKPTDVIVPSASGSGNNTLKWTELSSEQRIALRKSDLETYKKLYKAEYGVEFKSENE